MTGATPRDESAAALAAVLDELLRQPGRLGEMGARGGAWARDAVRARTGMPRWPSTGCFERTPGPSVLITFSYL